MENNPVPPGYLGFHSEREGSVIFTAMGYERKPELHGLIIDQLTVDQLRHLVVDCFILLSERQGFSVRQQVKNCYDGLVDFEASEGGEVDGEQKWDD